MFCLYYDAKTKKVHAMNGSGRSGQNVTLDRIRKDLGIADGEHGHIPMNSVSAWNGSAAARLAWKMYSLLASSLRRRDFPCLSFLQLL
jgi:hypothetical protein